MLGSSKLLYYYALDLQIGSRLHEIKSSCIRRYVGVSVNKAIRLVYTFSRFWSRRGQGEAFCFGESCCRIGCDPWNSQHRHRLFTWVFQVMFASPVFFVSTFLQSFITLILLFTSAIGLNASFSSINSVVSWNLYSFAKNSNILTSFFLQSTGLLWTKAPISLLHPQSCESLNHYLPAKKCARAGRELNLSSCTRQHTSAYVRLCHAALI